MKEKSGKSTVVEGDGTPSLPPFGALSLLSACGLGLAAGFWFGHSFYSVNLISDPAKTLLSILVIECPIVILIFSIIRKNPEKCSYLKAVGRGLLGLPIGALVMAFGAITLGAPVYTKYLLATTHWSLLMSLLTITPAACVLGSSWVDWQGIFAATRPIESTEYLLCFPAYGAIIGSWFAAWPMPLDWERPWQEWPICVTYGGIAGYVLGMIVSFGFVLFGRRQQHVKGD